MPFCESRLFDRPRRAHIAQPASPRLPLTDSAKATVKSLDMGCAPLTIVYGVAALMVVHYRISVCCASSSDFPSLSPFNHRLRLKLSCFKSNTIHQGSVF
jgi:hypothetical protein